MPMERIIIGADLSTKKLAFVGGFEGKWRMEATKINSFKEVFDITDQFILDTIMFVGEDWDKEAGILALIEEPISGRGGVRPAILQGYTSGIVQLAFQLRGAETFMISNSKWKKAVTGKGNADKDFVKKWLEENQSELASDARGDQDLIDASCIFRYGLDLQHRRRTLEGQGGVQGISPPVLRRIQRRRE